MCVYVMTDSSPSHDALSVAFNKERSIRRTVKVLEFKRKRVNDELKQLIAHLAWLMPLSQNPKLNQQITTELIQEAVNRLNDDAFGQLILQILQEMS